MDLVGLLLKALPSVAAVVGVVLGLYLAHRFLERMRSGADRSFAGQVILLALTLVGAIIVIAVIPMGDVLRGQLLSLLGILFSAAIALSSTTVLGNALAGLMLRAIRGFRMGDFVRVEGHAGRVSERGLLHTEIQNEDRELTTLPNLYLITHPVTTVRSSGTIISTTVSLGYDVPRAQIESALVEAAQRADLQEPFVQVLELGDFSVTYRIAGLLENVKHILSARSALRCQVLDSLHGHGIEIVSPTFMNTRPLDPDRRVIPRPGVRIDRDEPVSRPEDLVFDKAEEAQSLETLRLSHQEVVSRIKEMEKQLEEKPDEAATRTLEVLKRREVALAHRIDERVARNADD